MTTHGEVPRPAMMLALVLERYAGAAGTRVTQVPVPTPKADEVRLRVLAVSLNAADRLLASGRPFMARGMTGGLRRPRRDYVLGLDVVGVVDALGTEVTTLRVGDVVFGEARRTLAEYACAPARFLAPLPEGVSVTQAGTLPVAGCTALQALRHHRVLDGSQRVLVTGASGGVGSFAVQLAAVQGAQVTAVARAGQARAEMLRDIGAAEVIDAQAFALGDDAAAGRYDVIVDLIGDLPLGRMRRMLLPGGTLVLSSGNGGPVPGPLPRLAAAGIVGRVARQRLKPHLATRNRDDLVTLGAMVADGRVRPLIAATYPLAEAQAALQRLEAGQVGGKIVVQIASSDGTPV